MKKITLPIAKKLAGKSYQDIIDNIINVQPMSRKVGGIFSMGHSYKKFSVTDAWEGPDGKKIYHIKVHSGDVLTWLIENYKNEIGFINSESSSEKVVIGERVFVMLQLKWT